jgi:hypothetical protein
MNRIETVASRELVDALKKAAAEAMDLLPISPAFATDRLKLAVGVATLELAVSAARANGLSKELFINLALRLYGDGG